MESVDSSCFNGSEEEFSFWFSHEMERQLEKQASYEHNNITHTWNNVHQSRSNQEPRYSFASIDRFTERDMLVSNISKDISTRKDSSHEIMNRSRGSYQASSDTASDQLSLTDDVSTDFKQQIEQQKNVHNDVHVVCSNISRYHDTSFSPVTTPLIEHKMQEFHASMINENINYEEQIKKRPDQHGNEEKEEYTLSNGVSITTYSWMKSKNANNKGRDNHQRRIRQSYTRQQLLECEKQFYTTPYVSKEILRGLARRINLSERQVKVWFQNRRMKQKREKKYCQNVENSSSLDIGFRQVAQNLSSSNPESPLITDTSIESDESKNNVQHPHTPTQYKTLSPSQATMHAQPIFHLQSQQPRHAQTQLQPTAPTQSSSQFMPLQLQTTINMQQIASEHNRRLYMQPQQQHAHWQPQDTIHTQSQSPVMHTQSSIMQLQQQPITQQLQQPSAHALSQPQAMNIYIQQPQHTHMKDSELYIRNHNQ